jgi:sugar/nucleoside kinase (ribokinase family)
MPRFDVTIAGELNLDLVLYGLPPELPPERELLANRLEITLGSSSAIVAHNLSALGRRVGFISRIGNDALGKIALERLADSGVDLSETHRAEQSATGLTVILAREYSRNILTYLGTISELRFDALNIEYLASSRHFHLSSYYLQRALRPDVPKLLKTLKEAGLTISFDTNDDPDDVWADDIFEVLKLVDVFLPNQRELKKIAKTENLEQAITSVAGLVPVLVVKLGAAGAIAQRGSQRVVGYPIQVTAVDPVGAGDSFDAGFLSQYIRGADLDLCLKAGNLAGAFSTTRPGGTEAFRDQEYREQFWREHATR